jgi:xylulokinase
LTGNPVNSSFSIAKLLWLAANEPANMAKAVVWLAAKDYVRTRLTGMLGTDASDAFNSLLLDPRTLLWRDELIEAVGLDHSKFPRVHSGSDVAGEVTVGAARATGLTTGTPVLTGLGDMAALANSLSESGRPLPMVSLGTSTTLQIPVDEGTRPPAGFSVHPVVPGGAWFVLGSLLTGGLALDWLRRLGPLDLAKAHRARHLLFLPQLAGMGSPGLTPLQVWSRWPAPCSKRSRSSYGSASRC